MIIMSEIVADLKWLATGDNIAKMRRVRLGYAEIVTPERQHTISLEEMCRELLEVAVKNGLVKIGESMRQPLELSNGDVLVMANRLNSLLYPGHLIDCDVNPFVPDGWSVEKHQKGGVFKWNAESVTLYLDKRQKNGKLVNGNKLRKSLENKPVLNVNVLDYLLAHPHLIPEKWKDKAVLFWGTIYRGRGGLLLVRYLFWGGFRWAWFSRELDDNWSDFSPAAVLSS